MAQPKSYKAKFIEPGPMYYTEPYESTVLVSREALDRMAPSFRGCPVIFVPELHDDSKPETAFNFKNGEGDATCGVVANVPTWGDDGWQYVDMLVWDENIQKLIDERGFSVSCSYVPDDTAEGGEWHQLPYDEEIVNGHYIHMAIVPNPRYEGSRILANSKGRSTVAIFQKKKNAAPPPAPAKEEPKEEQVEMNADDAMVDVAGTPVPLYELIEAYKMKMGAGDTPPNLTPEDEVEVEGFGRVKVSELIAAYGPGEGGESAEGEQMENAEAPQDVKAEAPVDESRQMRNAAPKVKPKTVNAALKNAAKTVSDIDPRGEGFESQEDRLARGKLRYGGLVKQGGK